MRNEQDHNAFAFEQLEHRALLSAFMAEDLNDIVDTPAPAGTEYVMRDASRNGEFYVARLSDSPDEPSDGLFVFTKEGLLTASYDFDSLPANSRYSDVLEDGSIIVTSPATAIDRPTEHFIVRGDQITRINDSFQTIVGGPDLNLEFASFRYLAGNVSGQFLLNVYYGYFESYVYLLQGTTLTFLWNGAGEDMNASAQVVGTRLTDGPVNETVVFLPGQGVFAVPEFYNAGAISDGGLLAGMAPDGQVATARPTGVPGSYAIESHGFISLPSNANPVPFAVKNDGRILGLNTSKFGRALTRNTSWYFDPATMSEPCRLSFIAMDEQGTSVEYEAGAVFSLSDDGIIAAYRKYVLSDNFDPEDVAARPGLRSASFLNDADLSMAYVTEGGRLVVITGQSFVDEYTLSLTPVTNAASDVVAWRDVTDGLPRFAVVDEFGTLWVVSPTDNGLWRAESVIVNASESPGYYDERLLTSSITAYQRQDGLVVIAGVNTLGDLVLFGQDFVTPGTPVDGTRWLFDNLSESQFRSQGIEPPRIVGELDSYVTPWGSESVVGVDPQGRIQVYWTSPEFAGWTTSELSSVVGAPAAAQRVDGYVTAWHGLNLAFTDNEGELFVVWWAPQLGAGNWQLSSLTDAATPDRVASIPALVPGSVVAAHIPETGTIELIGVTQQPFDGLDSNVLYVRWGVDQPDWLAGPIERSVSGQAIPSATAPVLSLAIRDRSDRGDTLALLYPSTFDSGLAGLSQIGPLEPWSSYFPIERALSNL